MIFSFKDFQICKIYNVSLKYFKSAKKNLNGLVRCCDVQNYGSLCSAQTSK